MCVCVCVCCCFFSRLNRLDECDGGYMWIDTDDEEENVPHNNDADVPLPMVLNSSQSEEEDMDDDEDKDSSVSSPECDDGYRVTSYGVNNRTCSQELLQNNHQTAFTLPSPPLPLPFLLIHHQQQQQQQHCHHQLQQQPVKRPMAAQLSPPTSPAAVHYTECRSIPKDQEPHPRRRHPPSSWFSEIPRIRGCRHKYRKKKQNSNNNSGSVTLFATYTVNGPAFSHTLGVQSQGFRFEQQQVEQQHKCYHHHSDHHETYQIKEEYKNYREYEVEDDQDILLHPPLRKRLRLMNTNY